MKHDVKPGDIYAEKNNIRPHKLNLYIIDSNNRVVMVHGSNSGVMKLESNYPVSTLNSCTKIGTLKELSDLILKEVFDVCIK